MGSCPAPATVSAEGAGQTISGTATDVAGNSASAAATIKLDKTPPVLSITSPANGATVTSPGVSVTGNVSDALSGVSAVTCNGSAATIQAGTFNCSVTLNPGGNTISVQATDVAGNSNSQSVSVTYASAPAITSFSPASAAIGALVTITGSGFTANGTTPQVTLAGRRGTPLVTLCGRGVALA